MRVRNAFKISMANYALVFRNLAYKAVVFVLFALIVALVLSVSVMPMVSRFTPVLEELKNIFISVYNGSFDASSTALRDAITSFISYLSESTGSLVLTGVLLAAIIVAFIYVSGASDCALTILVGEYMTSMARPSFIRVFAENLGRIALFQLVRTAVDVVYYAAIFGIGYFLFGLAFHMNVFAAAFLTVFLYVATGALKKTLFSRVMTGALVGGKSVAEAFRTGFKPGKGFFFKMYAGYLTVGIIYLYLFVSVTLFTFGIGTLLLVPFMSLLVVTMRLVDRFTIEKSKYFIDYDNIVVPKELRENDENLLNNVEI